MTFLEGFAQGFTAERNRVLEEQNQEKQIKLKFAFEDIANQRAKREEQKLKDREIAQQSKALAAQLGNPEGAPQIANILKNGMATPQDIFKMYQNKQIEVNSGWSPTTTVKVPNGVVTPNPSVDLTEGYDPETRDYVKKMMPKGLYTVDSDVPDLTNNSTANDGPFVFNSKTEMKLGTRTDEEYKLEQLKSNPKANPLDIIEQQRRVDVIRRVDTEKTLEELRLQGKDVQEFVTVDENGRMTGDVFPGSRNEQYQVVNRADNNNIVQHAIPITKETKDRLYALRDGFNKDKLKYDQSLTSFNGGVRAAAKLDALLAQHGEVVNTYAGQAAQLFTKFSENVAGFSKLFGNGQDPLEQFKEAALNQDYGTSGEILATMESATKELESQVNSKQVRDASALTTLAESYKILAAMQMAQSLGIMNGKDSNKDIERIFKQVGEGSISSEMRNNLRANIQNIDGRLKSTQTSLENSIRPQLEDFKRMSGGISLDIKPQRVEQNLIDSGIDKETLDYYRSASKFGTSDIQEGPAYDVGGQDNQPKQGEVTFSNDDGSKSSMTVDQYNSYVDRFRKKIEKYPDQAPELIKSFDKTFGEGMAQKELGGR